VSWHRDDTKITQNVVYAASKFMLSCLWFDKQWRLLRIIHQLLDCKHVLQSWQPRMDLLDSSASIIQYISSQNHFKFQKPAKIPSTRCLASDSFPSVFFSIFGSRRLKLLPQIHFSNLFDTVAIRHHSFLCYFCSHIHIIRSHHQCLYSFTGG